MCAPFAYHRQVATGSARAVARRPSNDRAQHSQFTRPLYDIHNLAHAPLSSLQRVRVGDGEFDCRRRCLRAKNACGPATPSPPGAREPARGGQLILWLRRLACTHRARRQGRSGWLERTHHPHRRTTHTTQRKATPNKLNFNRV